MVERLRSLGVQDSTADGYEGVLRQYLRPRFATKRLDEVKRDDIKTLINDLIAKELSRNTVRNALCVIRGMLNQAIEAGLIEANPAARLGRFTRTANRLTAKAWRSQLQRPSSSWMPP